MEMKTEQWNGGAVLVFGSVVLLAGLVYGIAVIPTPQRPESANVLWRKTMPGGMMTLVEESGNCYLIVKTYTSAVSSESSVKEVDCEEFVGGGE